MQKDGLTGFFAREELDPFLKKLLLEAKMGEKKVSLALIDLDHFKELNNKFGQVFGEEVLKYATSTLRLTFSMEECHFFRYGGDEFIGIFSVKEPKEVLRLSQQCNYNLLHRPFLYANKFYKITMSCGIACFSTEATTADELIKKADEAMRFSKRSGRNLTTLASSIKYLKFRRIAFLITSIIIVLYLALLFYQGGFKKIIQPAVRQIENMKIITKSNNSDTVVLKSGVVLEGNIVYEDEDKITLGLYLNKGEGFTNFNKSEIARIKYGSRDKIRNIKK